MSTSELRPYDLWGSNTWCNQEVVGESHYLPALQRMFPRKETISEAIGSKALLVPEPANPHDHNAVAVHIDGALVGYLLRDEAARYQPALLRLASRGLVGRVACRIWGGTFTDLDYDDHDRVVESTRFSASVTVALAEPHLCVPVNSAPATPHMLLPAGSSIQVSGEDGHMPAITPFLCSEGECFVYATVSEVAEATSRGARGLVEVRLDARPVGRLTPKMSGDLLPAIRHLEGMGYLTAVRAKIKGNQLKAEVTLFCARSHELPDEWLSGLGTLPREQPVAATSAPAAVHEPIPVRPTRIRFATPPGWPAPPAGWEPSPGWTPDPSWQPAPRGWQYWVAE